MAWGKKSAIYVTDSALIKKGHGGSTVSYHEHKALSEITKVEQVYQNIEYLGNCRLAVKAYYPENPFMYDYYIASLLKKPEEIEVAQFYGSFYTLTMKRLSNAVKFATSPFHNLEEALREWKVYYNSSPPPHLTNDLLFNLGNQGLVEDIKVLICPSKASAQFFKDRFGKTNVEIIPHGTNLPENWSSEKKDFEVVYLGAAGPDKGLIYLITAWDQIVSDIKGKLIFAGSPITETLCKKFLRNNCLWCKHVKVLPYISEGRKHKLYSDASVYVQPSVTEGFGISVVEAMSYGVPVIATKGVGASDLIKDGWNGFVVPIRDPRAIGEKIQYFHDNSSEIKKMGTNARKTAEENSWEIIESKYKRLIKEVANL